MGVIATVEVRRRGDGDSYERLTALLHRAYAPLAARGMRYLASHQDEATTRERAEEGECFVAVERDGAGVERIVGTVTLVGPHVPHETPWYDRRDTARFGQFGVEPASQGRGVGRRLMDAIEARASELGAAYLALDTSERATELIRTYRRRGYEIVARHAWDVTNYRSVIMRKALTAAAAGGPPGPADGRSKAKLEV